MPIAMRIRWQIEQNVFAHLRGEIDQLRPAEFRVHGEHRHLYGVHETPETRHACQLNRLREMTVRPQRAFCNSDIDRVTERPGARDLLVLDITDRAIFLALKMQSFVGNLAEMD